jgi:RNase P/RNase MRP subunit POP5
MKKPKVKRLKLKPSARDKRRYLWIENATNSAVEKAILDYVGILGFAKSAYMKVKESKGKLVVAVQRSELEKIKASLGLAGISVRKVSGTLKGLG